ncbi:MAG: hypothetical protein WAK18_01795, partial [Nocardioidaceae bacterium]
RVLVVGKTATPPHISRSAAAYLRKSNGFLNRVPQVRILPGALRQVAPVQLLTCGFSRTVWLAKRLVVSRLQEDGTNSGKSIEPIRAGQELQ